METINQTEAQALPEDVVRIEKLIYGGDGLARHHGKVVLTPFVLPGELVRITPAEQKRSFLRGTPSEILEPAPGRTDPPCPVFGQCGGCQYQHAQYEVQLEQKKAILIEALERIGKLNLTLEPDVVSAEPWGYRNRAQFHLERGRIGYLEAGSNRLVPIEECPIVAPRINEALTALRRMQKDRRFPQFVRQLELFTNGELTLLNVLKTEGGKHVARGFFEWAAEEIKGADLGAIGYIAASERFRVSHGSFFQVNRFLIDRLVDLAVGDASGGHAVDLYAGVGLFTVPLARRFSRVMAVESTRSASYDLEANAKQAAVHVQVERGSVEDVLDRLPPQPDFVLADPPRAGLGEKAVAKLAAMQPGKLTIVSCDPSTLARDLAGLVAAGYTLQSLTLVDLFPQTAHIETVAKLSR